MKKKGAKTYFWREKKCEKKGGDLKEIYFAGKLDAVFDWKGKVIEVVVFKLTAVFFVSVEKCLFNPLDARVKPLGLSLVLACIYE